MWISLGGWSSIYDTKIECVFARQFDPGFLTHSQVSVAGCSPASIISKLISGPHDGWLMVDATSPVRPCKIVWWWSMYISMLDEFRWISHYFHISISIYFHIFHHISVYSHIFPYPAAIIISSIPSCWLVAPTSWTAATPWLDSRASSVPKSARNDRNDARLIKPMSIPTIFSYFLVDFWLIFGVGGGLGL